ncbi:TadE/TadG family type IV pilus assembly protein [Actinomadura physcomitrii]|uniref:TadE/TadG family type IV pilus assembly protein n=1 Tax=Actinomadura physcomitrii TaxID=2650748 RepID=UPI00136E1EB5|nr:TadE family protein [Actinomadura physcomitrii]
MSAITSALSRARGLAQQSERGSVSVFTVIITLVVLVFFGAVVDFEQVLEARQDAETAAQEAARAGTGHVDLDHAYMRGRFVVDRRSALRAARSYLRAGGYSGTATTTGAHTIRVHVTITRPARFLSLIGISALHADADATANLTTGVEGPHQP